MPVHSTPIAITLSHAFAEIAPSGNAANPNGADISAEAAKWSAVAKSANIQLE